MIPVNTAHIADPLQGKPGRIPHGRVGRRDCTDLHSIAAVHQSLRMAIDR